MPEPITESPNISTPDAGTESTEGAVSPEVTEGNQQLEGEQSIQTGVEDTSQPAAVDYQTQYNAAQEQISKQNQMFGYLVDIAKKGDISQLSELLGVEIPSNQGVDSQVNSESQVDVFDDISSRLNLDTEGTDSFIAAAQAAVEPLLAEKDKVIQDHKNALSYLMKEAGKKEVASFREKIPGFQNYESKIGEILGKFPGMSVEDAHILASHPDTVNNTKKTAIEDYRKEIAQKQGASNVFQPGDVSKVTSTQPRRFKDFAQAFEYTRNQMQ